METLVNTATVEKIEWLNANRRIMRVVWLTLVVLDAIFGYFVSGLVACMMLAYILVGMAADYLAYRDVLDEIEALDG